MRKIICGAVILSGLAFSVHASGNDGFQQSESLEDVVMRHATTILEVEYRAPMRYTIRRILHTDLSELKVGQDIRVRITVRAVPLPVYQPSEPVELKSGAHVVIFLKGNADSLFFAVSPGYSNASDVPQIEKMIQGEDLQMKI